MNIIPDTFYGLGIAPNLMERVHSLGFKTPTPIQRKAIPIAMEGKDVIGIAQTGTGKTLAFCIPMLQRLTLTRGRGLVVVPTRELAVQVNETFAKFAPVLKMRTVVIIGGESMMDQMLELQMDPKVIIATPGRLLDHIRQQHLRLDDAEVLVLDEADRMLDMGFAPQIEMIFKCLPSERQTMLFSATMPPEIMKMASKHMKLPVTTEIAPSGTMAEGISQEIFVVRREVKDKLLHKLLQRHKGSVLLFTRTKIGARKVAGFLRKTGFSAAEIHADRSQSQRKAALDSFKRGATRILVATDIAARGIDVTGIELVVNYDLPDESENYVHRIGRTGRAGREGHAISLATPDQGYDVNAIQKLIKTTIAMSSHPEFPSEKFVEGEGRPRKGAQRGGRGQGGGYGGQRSSHGTGGSRPRFSHGGSSHGRSASRGSMTSGSSHNAAHGSAPAPHAAVQGHAQSSGPSGRRPHRRGGRGRGSGQGQGTFASQQPAVRPPWAA